MTDVFFLNWPSGFNSFFHETHPLAHSLITIMHLYKNVDSCAGRSERSRKNLKILLWKKRGNKGLMKSFSSKGQDLHLSFSGRELPLNFFSSNKLLQSRSVLRVIYNSQAFKCLLSPTLFCLTKTKQNVFHSSRHI